MRNKAGKEMVSRSTYERLQRELEAAREAVRNRREVEGDVGWSDHAEGAQVHAAMGPLIKRSLELELQLRNLVPVDDDELYGPETRERPSVDEIISNATERADWYTLEHWRDDRHVTDIELPEGPVDPSAIAAMLIAEGEFGELRLMVGERPAPQRRRIAVFPLVPEAAPASSPPESPATPVSREIPTALQQPVPAAEAGIPVSVGEIVAEFSEGAWRFVLAVRPGRKSGATVFGSPGVAPVFIEVSPPLPCGLTDPRLAESICRDVHAAFTARLMRRGWLHFQDGRKAWYMDRYWRDQPNDG